MRELTRDEALTLLRRAVDEKGRDYALSPLPGDDGEPQGGFHFAEAPASPHGWVPLCIVGYVLSYLGLHTPGQAGGNGFVRHNAQTLRENGTLDIQEQALRVLQAAQTAQDIGLPWGAVVDWVHERPDADEHSARAWAEAYTVPS